MRHDPKRLLKMGLITIATLCLIVFVFFKTRDIIFGARLSDLSITDGQTFTDPFVEVTGRMKNAAAISINGFAVRPNQEGSFSDSLILHPGYNVLTINTEDKFGKKMEKTYTLIYNDEAAASN